MKSGREHNSLL